MKKLLIVDDLPQNLYMLEILLKTNGFEVEKAANGIEALDIAHKNPPEMIISDILMPGMDGFSLCKAWKDDERLKDIPFVFYTATYIDSRDEKLALSLGAERFIIKPMEPDAFLAILKEIIQNHELKGQVTQHETFEKEDIFYKEYNEALIRKLEDKMMELQKSNKRLASLYQTSSDLHKSKSMLDLIHTILQAMVQTAGYQQANFFSYDKNQKKLSLLAATGFSEDTFTKFEDKLVFNLGENRGLVGLVAEKGKTINIADTTKEPNWVSLDKTIQSALFTPVFYEKDLQGVIGLFGIEKNAFSEEDEDDIVALANNLAIALENIKNQENVKKQLNRISALHNIDINIMSSKNLHTTLDNLLTHVTTQLKTDAADILLFHLYSQASDFSAERGFITTPF